GTFPCSEIRRRTYPPPESRSTPIEIPDDQRQTPVVSAKLEDAQISRPRSESTCLSSTHRIFSRGSRRSSSIDPLPWWHPEHMSTETIEFAHDRSRAIVRMPPADLLTRREAHRETGNSLLTPSTTSTDQAG